MKGFIGRRAVDSLILFYLAITLNFFMFRLMPGDPSVVMIANSDHPIREEINVEAIRERWGLDRPLWEQYVLYIKNLLPPEMDMGESFNFVTRTGDRAVTKVLLGDRLINTIVLMGTAISLSFMIAMIIGTIAAWKYGTKVDISTTIFNLITFSMPVFWFGIMLLFFFSPPLPIGGTTEPGTPSAAEDFTTYVQDYMQHMVGPALTLTIAFLGGWFLIMRDTLLNIFTEDYMHSAFAKGLNTRRILFVHARKNAMLPMITLIALSLTGLVTGAILTETVFTWSGLGLLTIQAVNYQDYPVLQGLFLFLAGVTIIANFSADVIYAYMDPRIEY